MKGILVHSTTLDKLESILEDGTLFDSSKTNPEFDEGEEYKDLLKNKIFFQLVPETIELTGINKEEKGFGNDILLFFDIGMLEDYGKKKYTKSKEEKEILSKMKELKRIKYETNQIPKQKVWFNSGWYHGGFHIKSNFQYSVNYDKNISLEDNIKNFYDAKVSQIKYKIKELKEEYDEYKEDEDLFSAKEEVYWEEELKPEWSKTFTYKNKNEVVFQAKEISLKKYLLAIYNYRKIYNSLEKEYPEYLFVKTPEELKEFWKIYKV
jgi:hypothetical protein